MLVAMERLNVNAEMRLQNKIGRVWLGIGLDFGYSEGPFDYFQGMDYHSLGVILHVGFLGQLSVDVPYELIADASFIEMPQLSDKRIHPFDAFATFKCPPCLVAVNLISGHSFHAADIELVLSPTACENKEQPGKAKIETTKGPGG